jgi:catechol 2,3-dioxygenase-like lactoylglutathione lyase family enzyme
MARRTKPAEVKKMTNQQLLNGNITGLQHVGIPVRSLAVSVPFYEQLGFASVMMAEVPRPPEPAVQVRMMKLGDAVIELYELGAQALAGRQDGFVDHVALNVRDVAAAFRELRAAGIPTIENSPVSLAFWDKGCSYFCVRGPDGEKVEFNQIH